MCCCILLLLLITKFQIKYITNRVSFSVHQQLAMLPQPAHIRHHYLFDLGELLFHISYGEATAKRKKSTGYGADQS